MATSYQRLSEQQKNELKTFGCTVDQLRETVRCSKLLDGPAGVAATLMNTAHDEIEHNMFDVASQTLNRAKWILTEYCMTKDLK